MPDKIPGAAALDGWSLVHVASGYWLQRQRLSQSGALAILIGYEVFEGFLRQTPGADGKGLTEYESDANIAGDVVCGMLGYYLSQWHAKHKGEKGR